MLRIEVLTAFMIIQSKIGLLDCMTLKIKVQHIFETSVPLYQSTRCDVVRNKNHQKALLLHHIYEYKVITASQLKGTWNAVSCLQNRTVVSLSQRRAFNKHAVGMLDILGCGCSEPITRHQMEYYTQWVSTNIALACSDIISHMHDIGSFWDQGQSAMTQSAFTTVCQGHVTSLQSSVLF